MSYSYTNKKGKKYYLHSKGQIYFFKSTKGRNACDLPDHLTAKEAPTGFVYVTRR